MTENEEPVPAPVSGDGAGKAGTATPARRLFWFVVAIAAVVVLVDQATKWWAVAALGDGVRIPVVGDLLGLRLIYNSGAAFSIGAGYTWIFTIVAAVAVVLVGWFARQVESKPWTIALGLVLGGATTHLGDRLFRLPAFGRGHVVDFIDYGVFIGNVADIAIFLGAVAIFGLTLLGIELRQGRDTEG